MNIHTCIEILIKNAYKAGYACAVNKSEEWLNDKAVFGFIEEKDVNKFIEQYLNEIEV